MKTDRFDEEFRRKLQDLPHEAVPGEVERTFAYVQANKPAALGLSWGKLSLYGGGILLLIGSLVYNAIQHNQTTRLQTSLNSWLHRPVEPTRTIQHDTIYITRTDKAEINGTPLSPTAASKTPRESKSFTNLSTIYPSTGDPLRESVKTKRQAAARTGQAVGLAPIDAPSSPATFHADMPVSTNTPSAPIATGSGPINSGRIDARVTLPVHPIIKKSRLVPNPGITTVFNAEVVKSGAPDGAVIPAASTRLADRTERRSGRRHDELTPTNRSPEQATDPSQLASDLPPASPAASRIGESTGGRTLLAGTIGLLTTRQLSLSLASPDLHLLVRPLITPEKNLVEATGQPTRQAWHLITPRLSVQGVQYRVGIGLTGGLDQLAGGLLGDMQINQRWSIQGGVQVSTVDGFHYRDEAEFGRHRNKDFRQTYGIQEMASTDIEDIRLTTTLVQLPIQVAYHYRLSQQWGLRLGLGTELDLIVHSTLGYESQENTRSTERRQAVAGQAAPVFNKATLSLALERSWKKWQLRAGPFINPQLRSVSYKPEDLLWGGNIQVFYRLNR